MEEKQNNRAVIAFALCLCLAHLLPLYTGPIPIFYNDALSILGIIIAVVLVGDEKSIRVQIPWIVVLPVGVAVMITMQMLFGMLRIDSDAIYPIAYFLIAAIAVLLGASAAAQIQGSSRICMALTYAYLVAGLVSVGISFLQFFGVETLFAPFILQINHGANISSRPFANMGQPNQLALLLCISVASAWWLYQVGRMRIVIAIGVTLTLLCGLALTQSRIGWIIIPVFASLLFLWQKKTGFRKVSGWLIGCFVLTYALMVVMLPAITSFLIDLSTTSAAERMALGASSERLVLFDQAWKISVLHPWVGTGWGKFSSQQQALVLTFDPSIHSTHAHNVVLNFAAELGWPITILIFGIFSSWFFASFLRRSISPEIGFAVLFFMAVLVHSMVEFPLWYGYVLLPFALLMGMVHYEQFGSSTFRISRAYSTGLFLLMCILFIGAAIDYRRVVVAFRAQAWASLGMDVKGYAIAKEPNFTISSQFYDQLQFAKIEVREKMPLEQIIFMERVSQRFGYMLNLNSMALIYTLNDQPDKALDKLLTIKKLFRCDYVKIYKEWGKHAEKEPEKFMKVFIRLPAPTPSSCK